MNGEAERPEGLDAILQAVPIGIVRTLDGRVVWMNREAERIFGPELLGAEALDWVVPEERVAVRERNAARRRGEPAPPVYETTLVRPDGRRVTIEIEPRATSERETVIAFRDVTGRVRDRALLRALADLATSLQRHRSLDELLAAAAAGLHALGMTTGIVEFRGEVACLRAVANDPAFLEAAAVLMGRPLLGFEFPLAASEELRRVAAERTLVCVDDLAPSLHRFTEDLAQRDLRFPISLRGHLVIAPLVVNGAGWGALCVVAARLSPGEAGALELFATQLSSAIEVVASIASLERRNRELAAVGELARVGSAGGLDAIFREFLRIAADATASQWSAIYLADGGGSELVLAGTHGLTGSALQQKYRRIGMQSRSGEVALGLRPRAVDMSTWPEEIRRDLTGAGMRACAVFPLHVNGKLAGTLDLARTEERPYTEDELLRFAVIADQIAVQLDNASLYSEAQRRVRLLSILFRLGRIGSEFREVTPQVERILELLEEALALDTAAIHLARDGRLVLVGRRPHGAGELGSPPSEDVDVSERTWIGRAALSRRTVVTAVDPSSPASRAAGAGGVRHLAALPLVSGDRLVGTLLAGRRDDRPFAPDEVQLLESSVVQVGVAVENARLFEEERRRARDLSLINELGAVTTGHADMQSMLRAGVRHVREMLGAQGVFVHLREGDLLRLAASSREGDAVPELTLRMDQPSAAVEAIRTLAPVVIEDAMSDPRANNPVAARFGHRALLAVPLVARGEAVGAVILAENREGVRFGPAQVERAVAMSNQLAAAIANARLWEREHRRVRELSLLSEVGRTVAGTMDRDLMLSRCLEQVRAGLEFELGSAYLVSPAGELVLTGRSGGTLSGADAKAELALGGGLSARARESGAAVVQRVQDGGGTLFACAVPLLAGGRVIGTLALARHRGAVSDAELRILTAAATELGVGLENARLFDEARRRVDELKLLLDVGRVITASLDLEQILEASAGIVTRMVDASGSFIFLLDAAARELRGVTTSRAEHREHFKQIRIHLDEPSIAARCVNTRQPVAVADTTTSDDVYRRLVDEYGDKSLLALPLLLRDEPIGAVVLDERRRTRTWTDQEIERVSVVAHQMAVAVANARLFEDLRRSYGELARTQEELVKRERLAALGELAAVVAHEVRNPLGVIFNSLGSLRRILKPAGDAAMLFDIVGEEADRLNRIVGDLLDFARPHDPALQAESLRAVIEAAVEAASAEPSARGVRVQTEVSPELPVVRVDARMMRQALLNIVMNGLQAMPRGGTLTVRAVPEQRGGRPWARVEVADTGPGIPSEFAARIFQPFFTTKASGTGLGLAVVKRIVDAHRGEVSVESRPGAGTTFTLRLPIEEAR